MTGALAVPTIDLMQNATQEPMIRTRLANGAIQISWDNGQTYHNLYLPYVNSNVNMTTLEQVYNFVGNVAPAWSESATYAVGDIVSFMGAYYVCRMAGSTGIPATDISHWKAEKLSNLLAAVTIPVRQPPYLADEYFPITCERNSAEVTYTQSDVRIVTNTQVGTYELRTADSANLAIAYFGSSGAFNTEGSGVSNLMFAGQSPYSVTVTLTLTPTGGTVVRSAELEDALGKKQNTLTFDDTPTAGSNNPVKSGGIKTALDGKFDKTGGTITGTITLTNVSANTVEVASTPIAGGSTPGVDFIDPATDHTATLIIGSGGMVTLRRGATSVGGIPQFDAEGGIVNSGKKVTDFAAASELHYALGETITASATLADRTMNKVEPLSTNTTDIELSFPAATNGKARDFLVLINNPMGNTGTIAFAPPGGATIYGDGLEQTFAAGETWEVTVTEVATNQFLCKALKVTGKVVPWWLYFKAEEANVVVNMTKTGSPSAITLETSTDGETWTAFDSEGGTTPITLANIGDKVYFRAGTGGNTKTGGGYWSGDYHTFTLSGRAGAHGNAMSLLDGTDKDNVALTDNGGFSHLFEGCTNLTSAPELPATTLVADCYAKMFEGCTSLTSIPESLPATTLYADCYHGMFSGCTSLMTGPTILATSLAPYSMWDMFEYCSVLSAVEVRFTSWIPAPGYPGACQEWMEQVSSTGTIKCPAALGTNETITRDYSHCPTNWTVVNV